MKCLDKRVIAGLAAVALAVWLWAPGWAIAALPLLVVLVCPLSMFLMMRSGQGAQCSTPGSQQGEAAAEREAELVRLRQEIDTLKAQRAREGSTSESN